MSGGNGACAVCKHQRRKCEPNCELAAYFPANKMNDFRALHLVFGVANLTKLIKANGTEAARRRAAETLIWEAQWRERDPAEGCYREVSCLQRENAALRAENAALRRQAVQCVCCVARHTAMAMSSSQHQQLLVSAAYGHHPNTRPTGNVYNATGGVVPTNLDGSCYSVCYNGNGSRALGAINVRSANGHSMTDTRPHVPAPPELMIGYAELMIGYAHDDRQHAMSASALANGAHGAVGVPGSGAAGRGQMNSRDKNNMS